MKLVIDASIAAALLIDLAYSETAREAVSNAESALAPDLITYEIANTFWKIANAGQAEVSQLQDALAYLPILLDELVSPQALAAEAFELSMKLNHPAYDCFYLALAKRADATLITADRRLAKLLQTNQTGIPIKYAGS